MTFKLGSNKKPFTVHEDLLCATSAIFKNELQKKRKPVSGECPICHEEVDLKVGNVAFCRSQCGQNFHDHCIDKWSESQNGPANCPVCRQAWSERPQEIIELWCNENLEATAVQLYCNWLYTKQVQIDEDVVRDSEDFGICILQGLKVSLWINAQDFACALVATYFSENKFERGFWINATKYVYENSNLWCSMWEGFVMDVFLANLEHDAFQAEYDEFSPKFREELTHKLLHRMAAPHTNKDILKRYTNGTYELEG